MSKPLPACWDIFKAIQLLSEVLSAHYGDPLYDEFSKSLATFLWAQHKEAHKMLKSTKITDSINSTGTDNSTTNFQQPHASQTLLLPIDQWKVVAHHWVVNLQWHLGVASRVPIWHGCSMDAQWDRREWHTVSIWWEWWKWHMPQNRKPCWWHLCQDGEEGSKWEPQKVELLSHQLD